MGIIWRKVWRDLKRNKARTILAVLSTAVGIFALGLVFGLSGVFDARIMTFYQASRPAHITLWGGPFSPELVDALRRETGVAAVEGETVASFRWKLEGESEWRDGDVVARADFEEQRINLLRLEQGCWPDEHSYRSLGKHTLSVERQSASHFGISTGTILLVEIGERQRRVSVAGIVRAPVVLPPEWGGDAMFFATPEMVVWLADPEQGEDFNRLHVTLKSYSEEAAKETAERIEDRLEGMGLSVGGYEISDPNEHWVQEIVDATMIILMVMGILLLSLSGFLIVNTMNAILVQQVWQIGVMKAVGATFGRVMRLYLTTALIYGGLALLLAVPLGVVGAHLLAAYLLDMFNVETSGLQIAPLAVVVQIVVGVAVPLVAALIPVIGGVRISVREAISSQGISGDFGESWLDRLVGRLTSIQIGSRGLPRPVALSLRNAFRRKARVALTLATLTFSGAMFTIVLSTGGSFNNTIANNFSLGEDVVLELEHPQRVARVVEIAQSVPGVDKAEVWSKESAALLLNSGEEQSVGVVGVPPDSAIFNPNIVAGRSLRPDDGYALIFTVRLAEDEGIQVGDEITLSMRDEESHWQVVGLYLSVDDVNNTFFVPFDVLGREAGSFGKGDRVKVLTTKKDTQSQQRLIEALKDVFTAQQLEVVDSWSASQQLQESQASFGILTSLLLVMVILTAVVGGIGLMGTMSMNVVERRREIGVMRAIGASSVIIVGMFVAEGVLVGLLSWLLAAPLSYPGARLFSDVIGDAILAMPLDFVYASGGMPLWLMIVTLLSALASLWPALQATKISVRESLAYE